MKVIRSVESTYRAGNCKAVTTYLQDDDGSIKTVVWAGMLDEDPPDPVELIVDYEEHGEAVRASKGYKQ